MKPTVGRVANPALFLVAAICFFLPFFTVECTAAIPQALEGLAEGLGGDQGLDFNQGDLSETVTGWQLVTDDPGDETGSAEPRQPGPDRYVALAAFGVAVLGLILSWLRRPIGPALALLLGTAGVVLLIVLWQRIAGRIPSEAEAFVDFKAEYGFWIAVMTSALAGILGGIRLFTEREGAPAAYPSGPTAAPPSTAPPSSGFSSRPSPPKSPSAPPPRTPPPAEPPPG